MVIHSREKILWNFCPLSKKSTGAMSAAGDCPQIMEGSPEKSRPGPPALQSRFFDKSGKRARFFWFGARCSESRADEHNFGSAGSTGTRTLVPDVLRQCTGRQCSIQCHCTSAADGPERSQSGHLPKKSQGQRILIAHHVQNIGMKHILILPAVTPGFRRKGIPGSVL